MQLVSQNSWSISMFNGKNHSSFGKILWLFDNSFKLSAKSTGYLTFVFTTRFAYACVYQWETLPVVELTPDMFINFLAKFIDFHRASEISINCVTPVSFLDCKYMQRLFEILYDWSFYSDVRKFELMDTCTHSYAASQPDSNFSGN